MDKILNFVRKQTGYVSIEVIVVAGLIIGIGAITLSKFSTGGGNVIDRSIENIDIQISLATEGM